MNNRRPDLNLLVIFDAVARTGSVSGAASSLSLSQPAISHALNRLRRWADDPLFVRSSRGMTLTPHAESMRLRARKILTEAQELLARGTFDPRSSNRDFVIGTSDYAAVAVVPAVVRALRRKAPGINLQCLPFSEATLDDLAEGKLDMSFWGTKLPKKPFHAQLLFREHFIGVMSSTHPLAKARKGKSVTLKQYLSYPHAVVSMKDPGRSVIELELSRLGLKRRIGLVSHGFLGNLQSLHGTDLLSAMPSRLFHKESRKGVLAFQLPLAVPHYDYHLIWHERVASDPAVSWLRNEIAGTQDLE